MPTYSHTVEGLVPKFQALSAGMWIATLKERDFTLPATGSATSARGQSPLSPDGPKKRNNKNIE
jgi:hypothetical protein